MPEILIETDKVRIVIAEPDDRGRKFAYCETTVGKDAMGVQQWALSTIVRDGFDQRFERALIEALLAERRENARLNKVIDDAIAMTAGKGSV